jgi:hypothetical protein
MDIEKVVSAMVGKTIEEAQIGYQDSELTLFLDDGTVIDIIVDTIHADIPELDD